MIIEIAYMDFPIQGARWGIYAESKTSWQFWVHPTKPTKRDVRLIKRAMRRQIPVEIIPHG